MTLRIFLSCEPSEDALAALIARMLEGRGCHVWRHLKRSKSADYRAATSRAIGDAHIVIGLWSPSSSDSAWVIDECDAGRKKGAVVAVEIGNSRAPLGFSGVARVRLSPYDVGLGEQGEADIWEAIAESADAAGYSGYRRIWLDRSRTAAAINVAVNVYLFELVALAAAFAHSQSFFQGSRGQVICLISALCSAGFGYVGDWLAQKLGTMPRSYPRRLLFRWGAEVMGGVIGFVSALLINAVANGRLVLDLVLDFAVVAGIASFAYFGLLAVKFIPILASKRLQQLLLDRPG